MRLVNVAQPKARLDEMIARVKIAVVLQRWTVTASRGVNAEDVATEICLERHIEELHVYLAYVMTHPLLEDVYEETAILFASDRALCDEVSRLGIEQALCAGPFTPTQIGNLDGFRCGALDDRDELHPLCAQFVAKEAIDRTAVIFVGGVDRAQDVEVHRIDLAVAFVLAGMMAFAYFIGHFPKDFLPLINGGTLAILYCFTCLYLSTAGAGPWSVDAATKRS